MSASSRTRSSHHRATTIKLLTIEKIIIGVASFLAGSMSTLVLGIHGDCPVSPSPPSTMEERSRIEELANKKLNQELERRGCTDKTKSILSQDHFFQSTVRRYAVGMARASKKDFVAEIDMGVPIDAAVKPGQEDVLLLYSHQAALPDVLRKNKKNRSNSNITVSIDPSVPPLLDTKTAVAHCDYLNIILTDNTGQRKQCMAIVPQYESYHVQKWMRVARDKQGYIRGALDPKADLTLVSRGYELNGRNNFRPPRLQYNTRPHWLFLQTYLQALDEILGQLRPICSSIASRRRTIIVLVCNHGQSELLMNFVCAAQRRKLSISNAIVFATDEETQALAKGMGLATFYDERIFGSMPSEEAHAYGDMKFTAMMMAKVICVHLISMLGYNILFQDVDMIWYKHPLSYFEGRRTKSYFDMYFQDDGGHSVRYAPLSANSGFYYIRYNEKTQYFMNALLMAGDLVTKSKSHQQAMIALLNEHASLFGLRVKVLSRDEPDFPGGYQFHQKSGQYMRDFFAGKVHPYIFHMSWTLNKDNKVLFLRQMGDWYLQDVCISKTVEKIFAQLPDLKAKAEPGSLVHNCCAMKPLISCHYRDKPSKIPCKDSPSIDAGKSSFW